MTAPVPGLYTACFDIFQYGIIVGDIVLVLEVLEPQEPPGVQPQKEFEHLLCVLPDGHVEEVFVLPNELEGVEL